MREDIDMQAHGPGSLDAMRADLEDRVRRRLAITPGPWFIAWHAQVEPICEIRDKIAGRPFRIYGQSGKVGTDGQIPVNEEANADFIVHAACDLAQADADLARLLLVCLRIKTAATGPETLTHERLFGVRNMAIQIMTDTLDQLPDMDWAEIELLKPFGFMLAWHVLVLADSLLWVIDVLADIPEGSNE